MPKSTFFNLLKEKRNRIAELAVDEFSKHPYAQASISRIVSKAGIAKGSFYQYFENKLDLYQWLLFEVMVERKISYLRENPPPQEGDIFDQLEHMLTTGMRFGLMNPRMSYLARWIWQATPDPALAELHKRRMKMSRMGIRMLLEQGLQAGHIRPDIDLDIAADFFLAVLQHALDLGIQRLTGVDLLEFCSRPELADSLPQEETDKLIHGIVDLLRHGLGSGEDLSDKPFKWDFEMIPKAVMDSEFQR